MAIEPSDVIVGLATFVAIIGLSSVLYDMGGALGSEADPLSALLLNLVVPALLIGLMVSFGVSAARDT